MTTKETEYIKTWVARTKEKLVDCLGGQCQVCGYKNCIQAIDFHHIDPITKEFTISSWQVKGWDRLGKEARKCAAVCCRCHREIHDGYINPDLKYIFDDEKFEKYRERPSYTRKVDWDVIDVRHMVDTMRYTEICEELGIKPATLYKRLKKLGIRKSKECTNT